MIDTPNGHDDARNGRGRGAPVGNSNHVSHGLSARIDIWPKGCFTERARIAALEIALTNAVVAAGDLSLSKRLLIDSALRHERRALLCDRWLVKDFHHLKPDQRLLFLREVGSASDRRDKAIAALGLDREAGSAYLDALLAPQTVLEAPGDLDFTTGSEDAAGTNVEVQR